MAESENRENSVLFSLRELRKIEETRVTEEEDARRRAEEERVEAQMAAERRRREDEEARMRAQHDEARRRQEETERLRRDEEFRLQEAEARARVEAQAALEHQRMAHEMELRRQEVSKKRPTWLIAVAAALVLGVVGLGFKYYSDQQEAQAKEERLRRENEEQQRYIAQLEKDINDTQIAVEAAEQRFKTAATDKERADAEKEIALQKARLKELRERSKKSRGNSSSRPKDDNKQITISAECLNDPLCKK